MALIAGEGAGDLIRRHQGGFRDRLTGRPLLAFILVFGHDAGDVSGEGREAVRGRLTGSRLCGAEGSSLRKRTVRNENTGEILAISSEKV